MSSSTIETLIADVQTAFDASPDDIEARLDVDDAALLQLRKGCRLLGGAADLLEAGYFTIVIEASFVAIERTIEFRLLERGELDPRQLPGSHTGIDDEAARTGVVTADTAADLADLWREHRAKTHYQDGLATRTRAQKLYDLAAEVHAFIVGRSSREHDCRCSE